MFFKLVVAGGRDFNNYELMKEKLDKMLANRSEEIVIVSGCANGADTLGEKYAKEKGYYIKPFEANWDKEGKKAGHLRNAEMGAFSDAVVVFWDKKSRGSKNMIDVANKLNKPLRVIYY